MSIETAETIDQSPVYAVLAGDLAALDVEVVFGLFGEDTAGLVTQLAHAGIRYHAARHENAAVMMAAGYAAAADRLGVCITSRGPGLTNGLSGTVSASRAGLPVLIILGADTVLADGPGVNYKYLQGPEVLSHSGVKTIHPRTAGQARDSLREAAAMAMTGRTVAVALPLDVLNGRMEVTGDDDAGPATSRAASRPVPAPPAVALAAEVVDRSSHPLVVAGAGAYEAGARDVLVELADRTGALLGTTLNAKGLFVGHPYNIGLVGGFASAAAREVTRDIDCAVVFGASLNQFTTHFGNWFRDTRLVQIDKDGGQIGRYLRADVGIVGDARLSAEALLSAVKPHVEMPLRTEKVAERLRGYRPQEDFISVPDGSAMDPQALIIELDTMIPTDRMVVPDGGAHFCFVAPYMTVQSPDRFHAPIGFHSIGLGLGTAVGAQLARPELPTVVFVGDGALLMSLGELETVARTDLPILVVVVNDRSYGAEQHFVDLMGLPNDAALIPDVDFAAVAAGLGMRAATITSLGQLDAIREQLANPTRPMLLDCKVANVRPQLYDDLLGGDRD
jgi:thiamine pyrophosphate-dependent acetolactate synthase large subunit-like protein